MKKEEMKEKIVAKGRYKGVYYYIIRYDLYNPINDKWGGWFCAYVLPIDDKINPYKLSTQPHGGITWCGYHHLIGKVCWGWDYNHYNDVSQDPDNFLETKLHKMDLDKATDIVSNEIYEYIGGVLDEIGN